MTYCILIPHYNHERQLSQFLPELVATGLPCLIIDDGSSSASVQQVRELAAQYPSVHIFEMRANRGKGAAVSAGFVCARSLGFTHAIQIDADGQHAVADIGRFIAASEARPHSLICGKPVFDASVPKERLYGRKVTDVFVALETLSLTVKDSLCGYRVYPLAEVERVIDRYYLGPRMDFDTEILVKSVWSGVALQFIDTAVVYPENSVSHFNYLRDNLVLIRLHVRLLLGMLVRLPVILWRKLRKLSR